jgi:hypothetical protein
MRRTPSFRHGLTTLLRSWPLGYMTGNTQKPALLAEPKPRGVSEGPARRVYFNILKIAV